jgi:HEAT repeat protein
MNTVNILKEEILNCVDSPKIRRAAVWGLFYCGDPEAVPVLKTLLKVDPDENVRLIALSVLDSISVENSIGFFDEIARSDASLRVRDKAREYSKIKSISQ